MGLRERLEEELERTAEAKLGSRAREHRLALAPAVRETIVAAARLGDVEALVELYARRLPAERLEQLVLARDEPARWLWRELSLPRLAEGLDGLFRVLGADAPAILGARGAAELLAARPSVAELYEPTLFGRSAPLVGALGPEREAMAREPGTPGEILDLRVSGNLLHELCHGLPLPLTEPPPPWMILEACALHLGARARPAHVFPDVPGEAVRGVSLFVLVGDGLARLLGERAPLRVLAGESLAAIAGAAAGPLAAAGWQAWLARPEPPFVTDALDAEAWLKLADLARAGRAPSIDDPVAAAPLLPPLLAGAARTPWDALPWYAEEPTGADLAMVVTGVTALFQTNVMAPTFQTVPSDPPRGTIFVDVERCLLHARPRPDGVFGEPAWWIFPPPLARRLRARGVRHVRVEGARRHLRAGIAAALIELALGAGILPVDTVLDFAA